MPSSLFRIGLTPDFPHYTRHDLEKALEEILPESVWEYLPDRGTAVKAEDIDRFDALIVMGLAVPAEALSGIRRLGAIARWGVGYDKVDVPACTAADVLLAIAPEAVRRSVAEGILALLFAVTKKLTILDRQCRSGLWREELPVLRNLEGKVLGSVGAGNIAGELFRLVGSLGFKRLLAYDPFVSRPPQGVEMVPLETLLSESDFVTVNCPLSDGTRGLLNRSRLETMKRGAFLINTSRGGIVDEEALEQLLRNGHLAGAGLDVFEVEPVPTSLSLLQLDNVIATPHSIAWTQELYRDNSRHCCLNLASLLKGRPPDSTVNRAVLERSGFQAKLRHWSAL